MQGMKAYTRLSQSEREQLFLLHHQGVSLREIAKRLGRTRTTISREYQRHGEQEYSPCAAHAQAIKDRGAPRKHKLDDPMLQHYVIGRLGEGWSPEQIAGRLSFQGSALTVVHETIYAFLYQPPLKHERLWEFLRRGHKKRERWFDRRVHCKKRVIIQGKISITQRPEEAQTRLKVGHWETDLMEGTKKTHHVVSATVDRRSGALLLDKLSSKESREKMDVMIRRMERIPIHIRKTMTFDNGTENAEHRRLYRVNMDTYFCASYHSWEKGTVENTIGLVRQYLPKGGDLTGVSQQELMTISQAINDRPRKRLGYKTPNEVLLEEAGWCVTS
ncbi:MAG: Transposase insI for insertion sequence element IS30B/C/D [Microgenomates group bacterium GW2011_GWC1_43_11]|uniref:Transposase insI for insertion sequence element IS30B/C/D n=1 Tax=Candidatus Gottesmanbacteria bacterium GW2011_GWA1_44_24b TaxID=1618437 RepID=A0A0G1IP18_9BACT|nr:MAG: Transposase insI for insertion sequence element IS30B/C/D [Microgenomates group bacterium GW2011_GWC1_43_11]KKT60910.1 MAG: Transposase insI for insertion sequence element IS30B/C/D [Candidatus Gottesmanbacteria bacterium GW2011_GWA1_44_24b]HCM82510.1 IS30 family transposase [Patescibacteria group bacterium]